MSADTKKKAGVLKILLFVSGSLIFVFMIYYAVMALMSHSAEISAINSEYGIKEKENSKTDNRIYSDSVYVALNREKAYYQSRVLIAESDSIGLALNLSDSTATLEINGVAVHKAKITEIHVSNVLAKADESSVTSMLAVPLTVENDVATIKKEPVMLKVAPKDTSEYKPDILPDTTNYESVNYIFEMGNGIRLYVYQNAGEDHRGGLSPYMFDMTDRIRNFRDNLKSIMAFKVPVYHPAIKIRMAKMDAKIIYRALPKHGQVALFR